MSAPVTAPAAPTLTTATAGPWRHLDRRTLAVDLTFVVAPLAPVLTAVVVLGRALDRAALISLGLVVGGALLLYVLRVFKVVTTRYRIGAGTVEIRSGLLFRAHRSVPRDRVRSVDLTAPPLRRLAGLTVVRIGTGQSYGGTELKPMVLDSVPHAAADALRRTLLEGVPGAADEAADAPGEIVGLDRRWVRYAPASVTGIAGVWVLIAGVYKVLELVDVDVLDSPHAAAAVRALGGLGPAGAAAVVAAVVVAGGSLGSLLLFTEAWWGFRLRREPDGSLRIVRGLLTRRSVSLEAERLRGVELREPLTLRAARAGGLRAVATGLSRGQGAAMVGSAVLLPPVPVGTAAGVAGSVLGTGDLGPVGPGVALRAHPRAATRRRLVRAGLVVGVPAGAAAAAAALGAAVPVWIWPVLAIAAVAAVALALDSAASLGNALTERFLVVRGGSLVRSTVALERAGIVGWRVSRSPTQRRAGLCTLIATSAAGKGFFPARDVDVGAATALAGEATPGLLEPFLDRG